MRVQLTVRVEPHTADYIAELARNAARPGTRVSLGLVAAILLERAEAEGWQVETIQIPTYRPEQE